MATLTCKAGWKPGALDYVSYFAADRTDFFVGELNGKAIACMSAVKYSDTFAFLGYYIVDKNYRKMGYGRAIWETTIGSIPVGCNMGADAVDDRLSLYDRILGLKPYWSNKHVSIAAERGSLASEGFSNATGTIAIQPATEVLFSDLLQYNTAIEVYPRPAFLEKWISAPNCYAFAATNAKGAVVGYTVVRKILRALEGGKLGHFMLTIPQLLENFINLSLAKSLETILLQLYI